MHNNKQLMGSWLKRFILYTIFMSITFVLLKHGVVKSICLGASCGIALTIVDEILWRQKGSKIEEELDEIKKRWPKAKK